MAVQATVQRRITKAVARSLAAKSVAAKSLAAKTLASNRQAVAPTLQVAREADKAIAKALGGDHVGTFLQMGREGFACSTTVKGRVETDSLLRVLGSNWNSFWKLGTVENHAVSARGVSFDFAPLALNGFGLMHVHVELAGPVKVASSAAAEVTRVPVRLSRDLEGFGYYEIKRLANGETLFKSVWERARLTGFKGLIPGAPEVIANAHLAVEAGHLPAMMREAERIARTTPVRVAQNVTEVSWGAAERMLATASSMVANLIH